MTPEDLIEEIERNRRLSAFEWTPRIARDYCIAMPDKEMMNRYIEYLINQYEAKDLQNRSLKLKIEELTAKFGESPSKRNGRLNELCLLRKELSESEKESRSYGKKSAKLEEQLKSAKADRYGRSHRMSNDDDNISGMTTTDRTETEEFYDGSDACTIALFPLMPNKSETVPLQVRLSCRSRA